MHKRKALAASLFSFVLLAGAAPGVWALDQEPEVDCQKAQSTYEMNFCAEKDFEKADAELNKVYKEALARIGQNAGEPPYDKKSWDAAFRTSQRAWVAFRDADCKDLTAMEWQGGTGRTVASLGCMNALTAARTKDLRERYLDK